MSVKPLALRHVPINPTTKRTPTPQQIQFLWLSRNFSQVPTNPKTKEVQ